MKETMTEGVEYTLEFKVTEEKTVPELYPESEQFATMPRVFATGFMVGFMEWACMEHWHLIWMKGGNIVSVCI